jgi:hypothetical protein
MPVWAGGAHDAQSYKSGAVEKKVGNGLCTKRIRVSGVLEQAVPTERCDGLKPPGDTYHYIAVLPTSYPTRSSQFLGATRTSSSLPVVAVLLVHNT